MRKKVIIMGMVIWFFFITFCSSSEAKEPYIIGYQTDITGPGGSNYAPVGEGFLLYMQALNERGGINGHPVKVIYEDDKSSPSRAGAIATKLILEDKVLAILGLSFSHAQLPVYAVARKHGVPIVTGYTCAAPAYDPLENDCREIFGTGSLMHQNFHSEGYTEALMVSKLFPKGSTIGSSSYSTPGGRLLNEWGVMCVEKLGYKNIYHECFPPGTVDLTPWAQKIAKADVDVYMAEFGGEVFIPMLSALEKMGWKKSILTGDFMNQGDFVKAIDGLIDKNRHNIWIQGRYAQPSEKIDEYTKIHDAAKKYGTRYPFSNRYALGWTMGRLMEAALSKVGWPCTPGQLLKVLENIELDTRGLTGGPIHFSPDDHFGALWMKTYRWDPVNKSMVPAVDWVKIEPKKIVKSLQGGK